MPCQRVSLMHPKCCRSTLSVMGGKSCLWGGVDGCWSQLAAGVSAGVSVVFLTPRTSCMLGEEVASAHAFTLFSQHLPQLNKSHSIMAEKHTCSLYTHTHVYIRDIYRRSAWCGVYVKFNKGQRRWLSLGSWSVANMLQGRWKQFSIPPLSLSAVSFLCSVSAMSTGQQHSGPHNQVWWVIKQQYDRGEAVPTATANKLRQTDRSGVSE